MSEQILIPRKGGPLDGIPLKCPKSVYDYLEEGQLFSAFIRDTHRPFTRYTGFFVKEVTYRLYKNSAGEWEVLYLDEMATYFMINV